MKIGILTFHNAINYGAVIQCYALREFLVQRGYDVQVIDYRVPSIEDYKNHFLLDLSRGWKGAIKSIALLWQNLLLYNQKKKVIRNFEQYLHLRLNLSGRVYSSKDIPQDYDYIFFGSDQIWNPKICKGFDPVMWGQFKKGAMKFVTYAASFGELSFLSNDQWAYVKNHISTFDFVSVRENSVKSVLSEKTGRKIDCCIDPTLLVDSNIFETNITKPDIDNYILLYNITRNDEAVDFACRIASKLNCKVVIVEVKPNLHFNLKKNVIYKSGITPDEFLGYIKYARLTVGNSFHLIALSIVMENNFYSLDSYRPERVLNLLSQLGLSERHKQSSDIIDDIEDVDYSIVRPKLQALKQESLLYIHKIGC